jgi:predicted metal-dependent hydrolase
MTQSLIKYNDLTITHIINPRLKHSYIKIDEYGNITLKTPKVSQNFVIDLLSDKESWIKKSLKKIKPKPTITLGKEIEFFGKIVDVQTIDELSCMLKRAKDIQKVYDRFYKQVASSYIPSRVEYFAKKMDLKYSGIRFRKMKRRWGSCSNKHLLTFNTNLIKKDKSFIDEVVVHELSHIVYFNHSKDFYDLLKKTLETG